VSEETLKADDRLSVFLRAWAPKGSPRGVVGALVAEVRRRGSVGRPVFLYGHSTGANRALCWQISHPEERLAGIVASRPSVTMENGLDLANLSRDPAAVEAIRRDPLFHTKVSVLLGVGFLRSWAWFARWPGGTLASPVLIHQGTADRCVDPRASISVAGLLKGDVTLKTWDRFYHVLHCAPEKDKLLAFIAGWMAKHVA
jgi:alpha-beta hydrolase superfamily lysophospholipase